MSNDRKTLTANFNTAYNKVWEKLQGYKKLAKKAAEYKLVKSSDEIVQRAYNYYHSLDPVLCDPFTPLNKGPGCKDYRQKLEEIYNNFGPVVFANLSAEARNKTTEYFDKWFLSPLTEDSKGEADKNSWLVLRGIIRRCLGSLTINRPCSIIEKTTDNNISIRVFLSDKWNKEEHKNVPVYNVQEYKVPMSTFALKVLKRYSHSDTITLFGSIVKDVRAVK